MGRLKQPPPPEAYEISLKRAAEEIEDFVKEYPAAYWLMASSGVGSMSGKVNFHDSLKYALDKGLILKREDGNYCSARVKKTPTLFSLIEFQGLKLKSNYKEFLIFVGEREDVIRAFELLAEVGIESYPKQHGSKRHGEHVGKDPLWILSVPEWLESWMLSSFDDEITGSLDHCLNASLALRNQGKQVCITKQDGLRWKLEIKEKENVERTNFEPRRDCPAENLDCHFE